MSDVFARLQARIASQPCNAEGMRQAVAGRNNMLDAIGPGMPPVACEARNSLENMGAQTEEAGVHSLMHGHKVPSSSLPVDNNSQVKPPTHGGPQVDRLKDLLLPFQAWPVALALDAAGQIQITASRLLLPQMQAYCEQHGPELQAFLKSCPGHAWRSGEAIRRSGKHEGQGTD